jgi:hypothetical protein
MHNLARVSKLLQNEVQMRIHRGRTLIRPSSSPQSSRNMVHLLVYTDRKAAVQRHTPVHGGPNRSEPKKIFQTFLVGQRSCRPFLLPTSIMIQNVSSIRLHGNRP